MFKKHHLCLLPHRSDHRHLSVLVVQTLFGLTLLFNVYFIIQLQAGLDGSMDQAVAASHQLMTTAFKQEDERVNCRFNSSLLVRCFSHEPTTHEIIINDLISIIGLSLRKKSLFVLMCGLMMD